MRIAIGGIEHETNTYATDSMGPTGLEQFDRLQGDEILGAASGRSFLGGLVAEAQRAGHDIVPLSWAFAGPSGIIERAAYEHLRDDLVDRLRSAGPVDAVAVSMHGAGVVDGIDDLETDLARCLRDVVGASVPIAVPLDLHGNITQEMVAEIDLMLGVQEYPHTDMYERGVECIERLPSIVEGRCRPTTAIASLPLLLPTSTTDMGPAADIRDACLAAERQNDVIDVSFFHGFPYTDVPGTGASVIVTTDDDPELASSVARDIASQIWDRRDDFLVESVPPDVAIDVAKRHLADGDSPVVVNDTSDNPGGGTPGDGTHLLRAMVDANVENSCFGFVFDPTTAAAAHRAGVGATLEVRIGGRHGPLHGEPLVAEAYVAGLTDGRITYSSPMLAGVRASLGPSARLRIGAVDVIVTSRRNQTFDAEIFLLHGIDVTRRSIVGLKSSQHFRAGFRDLAGAIVTADSPGLTTLDVTVFDHPNAGRRLWPLDPDTTWP